MNLRRQAREIAIQYLYRCDLAGTEDLPVEEEISALPTAGQHAAAARPFAAELARGVIARRELLDEKIRHYAQNWSLERIAAVDRAILRLAIYELLFRDDIPPVVSINEAIDLAKNYSTADSGRFVNGILDRVKFELKRPLRTPAGTPPA
ncbi:MAG: transcription antitermination factor NusB [Verrucomicrobiae bacterium]|nr:transcription antitermination factor NusB [Verrucomicrobiae bacterium]